MTAEQVQGAAQPPTSSTMTLDDFITGLLAALAAQGVHVVSIRDREFYEAVENTYKVLADEAPERAVELLFHISRSRMYRDSPDVREGIARAVQRDLISLDNPEYQDMRLKMSPTSAGRYLSAVPGGSALFEGLARRFLQFYPGFSY